MSGPIALRYQRVRVSSCPSSCPWCGRSRRTAAHGRDDERDDEREHHRRRGPDGDRPHVRTHQAAHEGHRQDGRDDSQGGQDRRVAHLVDRAERHGRQAVVGPRLHPRVPDDVLDDDDGVVDEDADREDEREQRDAVQRVAVQVEHEQRQRERDGDGHHHDERLAPAERDPDEDRHRHDRDAHVIQEFVALLRGSFAVVAGDLHVHVGGHQRPLERFHLGLHAVRDRDGVGAGSLGHRERDGRHRAMPARVVAHVGRRVGIAVGDRGDVGESDGAAGAGCDDHITQLRDGLETHASLERAGLAIDERAGGPGARVAPDGGTDHQRVDAVDLQPGRVDLDAGHARPAADDGHLRHVGHFLDGVVQLRRQQPQLVVVVTGRPERHAENRHVVDRAELDEGPLRTRWNLVDVAVQLLVQAHHRPLLVLADLEADDDQRPARTRRGVHVLDAGNLPEQFLDGSGDALLDLRRRGAREIDEHVHHRDDDLRLFLARQAEDGHHAEGGGGHDHQRRELGVDEGRRDATGGSQSGHHLPPVRSGAPSVRAGGGFVTMRSPSDRPLTTSTPSRNVRPSTTMRSRAVSPSAT